VHHGQRPRAELREPANGGAGGGRDTGVAEVLLRSHRGAEDVTLGERGRIAHVGEEIAGEERAGGLLVEQTGVPAMGHVRRVEAPHPAAPEVEDLAIRQRARRSRRLVVQPDGAADRAVGHGGVRRGVEPFAERAALVGLDVTEGDPAQAADVHHAGHRLGDGREQRPLAAVEEQGIVRIDQELVEREPAGADRRHKGREPVDPLGDLVDARLHGCYSCAAVTWAVVGTSPAIVVRRMSRGWLSS
jgi:hypothetical protein